MKRFDVDTVVFDLDGTLIDSKKDIATALNKTFIEMDYEPLPMETIAGFVGNGVAPLIRRAVEVAGHTERLEEVMTLFRRHYWDHLLDSTRLFEGVSETLEKLDGRYHMGLVSNKPERYTKRIVAELGLAPFVGNAVFGGDTLPVKKPDPSALLEISRIYSTPASRMLLVGDSAVDVQTAKNAGARSVGVTYGFRDVRELVDAGADALIGQFSGLVEILGVDET